MNARNFYFDSTPINKFVIATHNPIKVREYQTLLEDYAIETVPLPEMLTETPAEMGNTFEANAQIKARYYSERLPEHWILADDSGLTIVSNPDILGVDTKEELASYPSNHQKNHRLIQLADRYGRACVMMSVVGLAHNGNVEAMGVGELKATIATAERGNLSEGFDRILIPAGETKTLAELPFAQRKSYLHRQRAVNNLRTIGGNR